MSKLHLMSILRVLLSLAIIVSASASHLCAGNRWPQFRGPQSDNIAAADLQIPTTWSETENVVWKLPTELRGWSTPAVWDNVAVMTEATEDGSEMFVFAVSIDDGKMLWRKKLFTNESVEEIHLTNSYASPSPVTDGQSVWVSFGSYGTACLQLSDGGMVWERRDFPCLHWRGPGSSPVIDSAGRMFINFDGFDLQYVVALNAKDGSTIWKHDRDIDYGTTNGDQMKAFSTPKLIDVDGKRQLISPASRTVIAYEPASGDEIWRVAYSEHTATAQPLYDGTTLFVNSGFGKAHLFAIDPRGHGDITDTNVKWVVPKGIGSVPSQLLSDGLIYNVHDAGVASCLDADSGDEIWTERLGGKFSASLLLAGGNLYLFDHDGASYVLKPGREFNLLAKNQLEDGCMASPVPLGDGLLVRTKSALYRIGRK